MAISGCSVTNTHLILCIDVGATLNEVLQAVRVACAHCYMERGAPDLGRSGVQCWIWASYATQSKRPVPYKVDICFLYDSRLPLTGYYPKQASVPYLVLCIDLSTLVKQQFEDVQVSSTAGPEHRCPVQLQHKA